MNGAELKLWRQKHEWSQVQAAEKLKLPLSTYKQREYGRRVIPGIMEIAMRYYDLIKILARQEIDKRKRLKQD